MSNQTVNFWTTGALRIDIISSLLPLNNKSWWCLPLEWIWTLFLKKYLP